MVVINKTSVNRLREETNTSYEFHDTLLHNTYIYNTQDLHFIKKTGYNLVEFGSNLVVIW